MNKTAVFSLVAIVATVLVAGFMIYSLFIQDATLQKPKVMETEPFAHIDVEVKGADIVLKEGDSFSLSYRIQGRERVKEAHVVNDTLRFDTGVGLFFKPKLIDGFVVITVPRGTELGDVNLKTVSGSVSVEKASGHELDVESVSSHIKVVGVFDDVSLESVSGNISFLGASAKELECESVSGDIDLKSKAESFEIDTISGKVTLDGEKVGREVTHKNGDSLIKAKTVSGDISLE